MPGRLRLARRPPSAAGSGSAPPSRRPLALGLALKKASIMLLHLLWAGDDRRAGLSVAAAAAALPARLAGRAPSLPLPLGRRAIGGGTLAFGLADELADGAARGERPLTHAVSGGTSEGRLSVASNSDRAHARLDDGAELAVLGPAGALAREAETVPPHASRTGGCAYRGRRAPPHAHARRERRLAEQLVERRHASRRRRPPRAIAASSSLPTLSDAPPLRPPRDAAASVEIAVDVTSPPPGERDTGRRRRRLLAVLLGDWASLPARRRRSRRPLAWIGS